MLSFWHVHAWDYARQIKSIEGTQITVVWDEQEERGRKCAEQLGVPYESNLDALLARDDVDAVIVDAPSNMHGVVIVKAAKAGKDIFTEKVLALTVKECDDIIAAVNESGVKFMISLPFMCNPQLLFAKEIVDKGLLGKVTLMRTRNAHNGEVAGWLPEHFYDAVQCGGGAMIDLGCHPMYLSFWMLGRPTNVTARLGNFLGQHEVDDNSVVIVDFESRAMAIVETGFVTGHSPFTLELYGTEGTLLIGGTNHGVQLRSEKMGGEVNGWVQAANMPKAPLSPMQQWVELIKNGTEPAITIDYGRQLTELMQAATISNKEGRSVSLPL